MFHYRPLPDDWKQRVADPENPTYIECGALGFHHLKPGKQCAHPGSSWFRDPRPTAPPLRSRTAILTAIFREHTAFDQRCHDVLSNYLPRDDPGVLARERSDDAARTFPRFMLLPPEIREQIWELALPRRTFDLRETRHLGTYTEVWHFLPPVPYIADVCREARDVVMRRGTRLYYAWTDDFRSSPWGPATDEIEPATEPDTSSIKITPVGFFVRGCDIVLHMPDPSSGPELDLSLVDKIKPSAGAAGVSVMTLTAGTMTPGLRCREMAVNWAPSARKANARSYPGSLLPKPWRTLKTVGPDLQTVYTYYRSTFIEVTLWMADEFFTEDRPIGCDTEVQLLLDMYDDQRLAELSSLETIGLDTYKEGPRFATTDLRNPGLCLNCERVQWEQHIKPAAVCQWLQLFEEELDEPTYQSVFHPGAELGYDTEHPWVEDKLRGAPEFRPAVLIRLQIAPNRAAVEPEV